MTRVSRSDTLLTELRDIKRRLRLLEAARMRGPVTPPTPLSPVRPVDWPTTTSAEWETLAAGRSGSASGLIVHVTAVAETGTSGAVRVLVNGAPVADDLPVAEDVATHTIPVAEPGAEITVEARRLTGQGTVRVGLVAAGQG